MARPKIDVERQSQIMHALEACVIRQGLANTSLKDVAAEADLARPLVRYFVGNRDQMISKLFDSVIERGEAQLAQYQSQDADAPLSALLDLLFNGLFADETSNALIGELWYVAERDEAVRAKLATLYQSVRDGIADALAREGFGKTPAIRLEAAHALVALSYGQACFEAIGLPSRDKGSMRAQAQSIIETLNL
jgi:AcrR family transcriptional regulator